MYHGKLELETSLPFLLQGKTFSQFLERKVLLVYHHCT